MILDISSVLSNNQAITVTAPSTGVYDTAGVGVGVAAPDIAGIVGGVAATFGNDIGSGGPNASGPQLVAIVGTAFTAGGAATLEVELQSAVDAGGGTPGTWKTILQTDTYALATLVAGAKIADFTVPPQYPGLGAPRFYRVNYVVATGPMTAGSISTSALLTGIDNLLVTPANY
jgi:hypothetical protein